MACGSATLSTASPDRPSCACCGLEPHRRTSRCARPQSTPSPRYCSPAPLRVLRTALAVLLTVAVGHRGPPGATVSPVAVLQRPWLRDSTSAPSCELPLRVLRPAVRLCQAPSSLWATRETIATPGLNVYSGRDRFFEAPRTQILSRNLAPRTPPPFPPRGGRGPRPSWHAPPGACQEPRAVGERSAATHHDAGPLGVPWVGTFTGRDPGRCVPESRREAERVIPELVDYAGERRSMRRHRGKSSGGSPKSTPPKSRSSPLGRTDPGRERPHVRDVASGGNARAPGHSTRRRPGRECAPLGPTPREDAGTTVVVPSKGLRPVRLRRGADEDSVGFDGDAVGVRDGRRDEYLSALLARDVRFEAQRAQGSPPAVPRGQGAGEYRAS